MTTQLDMFASAQARNEGMAIASDHAEACYNGWNDVAYNFLVSFLSTRSTFMTEDVREASDGIVPNPPSNRAWGSVVVRAAKNGLIERIGYGEVSNKKAHCTPASIWRTV